MKATRQLHNLGQRIWLDNITRELLTSGTLSTYINEYSVTGLTSNPTIFERAVSRSQAYDHAIERLTRVGQSGEALFIDLALQDVREAADLFRPIHETSGGADGWVSIEVSPEVADNISGTITAATALHSQVNRSNVLIKIPGTGAGIAAIEESIFAGIPVNVTLLFSWQQYVAAANAYMNGIERRIEAGLHPHVASVASIFVSRWDVAVKDCVSPEMRNRLGIAVAKRTYKAYRDLLDSARWQRLADAGARTQRLLWASTGTKDPDAAETLYMEALAAPATINTVPEKSLLAFADYGKVTTRLAADGGNAEEEIAGFERSGVDVDKLAKKLQHEGTEAFSRSWDALIARLAKKQRSVNELQRNAG